MRIGKFKVSQKLLKSKRIDHKFYLQVLFFAVIIMNADPVDNDVEYQAICDQFDDIKHGEAIPEYEVFIIEKENRVEFKRKVSEKV